jgi:hypothetical protein
LKEDLQTALDNDQYEIKARLADTFGSNRVTDHPIPFILESEKWFFIDDDELGLDFGVIPLDVHYLRLLRANGIVALQEENWIHQENLKFDGYAMLGFPEEFTSEFLSETGDGVVSPTIIPVRALNPALTDTSTTQFPRFVGELSPKLSLKTIRGMSGGPIFGFCLEPKPRYWIVALQSSWHAAEHKVYGCSLPVLASLMTKWAEEEVAED